MGSKRNKKEYKKKVKSKPPEDWEKELNIQYHDVNPQWNLKQEYSNISPRAFDSIIATKTMIMIKVREMLKKKPSGGKIEKEAAKRLEGVFGTLVKFGA